MAEVVEIFLRLLVFFTLFALFHSVTANEWFKDRLARVTGTFFVEYFWRFIYCVISFCLLKYTVIDPLNEPAFTRIVLTYPLWLYNVLAVSFFVGVVVIYWALVQVDYFEFWGLRQMYRGYIHWKTGKPVEQKLEIAGVDRLEVKGIYHVMRHPMLTGGFLVVASSPPSLSVLCYSSLVLIYMIIGGHYEEVRLNRNIGSAYAVYCQEVGAFFPKASQSVRWSKYLLGKLRK